MAYTDIKVKECDSVGVLLEPVGYCSSVKDYISKNKGVRWQKEDKWYIFVNWTALVPFAEYVSKENFLVRKAMQNIVLMKDALDKQPMTQGQTKKVCVDYHGDDDKGELKCSIGTRDSEVTHFLFKNARVFHKIDTKQQGNSVYFTCTEQGLNVMKSLSRQEYSNRYIPFFSDRLKKRIVGEAQMEIRPEKAPSTATLYPLVDIKSLSLPFDLYDFQIEDATTLVNNDHMLIAHDMGCGKTLIATLVGLSIPKPKLIICPESLRLNWRKEIRQASDKEDIHIIYSKDKEFKLGKDANSWNIMGYHTMAKFKKELVAEAIPVVFIDEAHNCKSVSVMGKPASKRADAALAICRKAEYVYPITGTPIPTSNKDLFNILCMLEVPKITKNFYHYGQKFCDGKDRGFGWDISGNSNSDELHEILSPYMVRRLKKIVLPHLHKQRIFLPMQANSASVNKECNELLKMISETERDNFLGYAMKVRRLLSGIKVKPCMELAENMISAGKSVVIVSEFVDTINAILKKFGDDACCIRGGMTDKKKQATIDAFQNGEKKVCAINMQAGGVGITLTKASNMIICDYDWTPASMAQIEDRICRSGQTEDCTIYYLYAEDMLVDEVFVKTITSKNYNIDRVIDMASNSMDLNESLKENSQDFFNLLKKEVKNAIKNRVLQKHKEEQSK